MAESNSTEVDSNSTEIDSSSPEVGGVLPGKKMFSIYTFRVFLNDR